MIKTLYKKFQHWSDGGSIYIISDTHFDDSDCEYMDADWITPEEHIKNIKKYVRKNDTLIHLGDVGNVDWIRQLDCYKVLIMGNHDTGITKYENIFNEVYNGALFISDKILLSHEPLHGEYWFNIHGHDHGHLLPPRGYNYVNLASNHTQWGVFNLGAEIKKGLLSKVDNIHRATIDRATEKKYGS